MRNTLALVAGVLILVVANWTIYARERHLANGRVVLLELAPVDPRSLMQGDYMALRFQVENDVHRGLAPVDDGRIVVRLDERGVGRFVRRDDGTALADREAALRYRVRAGRVKFASNAFLFEEGRAAEYERARFGEFRVDAAGDLLLTGLRGRDVEPLGRPAR